jgi:hypothetical protein
MKASGVLPGEFGIPPNLTSALPACGACHSPTPNSNGRVTVHLHAAARVLAPGATTNVDVHVAGGPGLGLAGFTMETDAGQFVPGMDTRVTLAGDAITHANQFGDRWQFSYTAPLAPGLVRFTAAGQAINGNQAPSGDSFGFWGPNSDVPGVAFRLFVNAANVAAVGDSCAGSDSHVPVFGARADARVGQVLRTELHGVAPARLAIGVHGTSTTNWLGIPLPFDLAPLGAPGCAVRVDHALVVSTLTAGSGSGGGTCFFDWPIPNVTRLRGSAVVFQAYVQDPSTQLGLVTSNALRAVIQP